MTVARSLSIIRSTCGRASATRRSARANANSPGGTSLGHDLPDTTVASTSMFVNRTA